MKIKFHRWSWVEVWTDNYIISLTWWNPFTRKLLFSFKVNRDNWTTNQAKKEL